MKFLRNCARVFIIHAFTKMITIGFNFVIVLNYSRFFVYLFSFFIFRSPAQQRFSPGGFTRQKYAAVVHAVKEVENSNTE